MIYIPPKTVEHKGVIYEVNDDHLDLIELSNRLDEETDGFERAVMAVTYIFGYEAPVDDFMNKKAFEILTNGKEIDNNPKNNKKLVDFEYDYNTIRMDILREYGQDILKGCSWFDFMSMVENLGKDSVLNKKAQARDMDLSKIKDPETKKAWAEFKKQVALPNKQKEKEKEVKDFYKNIMDKFNKKGG